MGFITSFMLLGLGTVHPAAADNLAFTLPSTGMEYVSAGNPAVDLGMVFTANVNLTVYALGFLDFAGVAGEEVGIFDSTGTLLTSANVSLTDPVVGGFFMHSITPIALTAGQQYTVVDYSANGAYGADYSAPLANSNITFTGSTYHFGGSFGFPVTHDHNEGYYGPNFDMDPLGVPEPGSLTLFGSAMAGWLCLWRRSRRGPNSSS